MLAEHPSLGAYHFICEPVICDPEVSGPQANFIFTENEMHTEKLFSSESATSYTKDAFHEFVVKGLNDKVRPFELGTKAARDVVLDVSANGSIVLKYGPKAADSDHLKAAESFGELFDLIFHERIQEADEFYEHRIAKNLSPEEKSISRQAFG